MSQMAVSNIAGQSLLGNVNIIPSSQSNGHQCLLNTVSVMNTEPNVGTQHLLGAVSNVLPGQNMGQQSLLTTTNQTTSTFGPFSRVSEIEKRRYHQQLVLLLHAYKCLKRDSSNGEVRGECNLGQCQGMRNVLSHIQVCQAGNACTVQNCASSRALILHWRNCTQKEECALCLPIKQAHGRWQQQAPVVQASQPSQAPNPAVVQRANASLGLSFGTTNSGVVDSGMQNQSLSSSLENEQTSQSPSQLVNHIQLPPTFQQQSNVQLQTMLQSSVSGANTNSTTQVEGEDLQATMCEGLQHMGEGLQATIKTSNAVTLMNTSPSQMSPLVSSVTGTCVPTNNKDWHQTVAPDFRQYLIQRIIQEILLVINKNEVNDPNDSAFNSVIQYARRNEAIMYETANTREEYYHLLAEKMYKIHRKEL